MNEEIKEILDDLDYCIARKRGTITLNHKDCGLLLDCIANLVEENEKSKERISYLERSNDRREDTILGLRQEIAEQEDYKSRCEKASELLKSKKEEYSNLPDYHQYYVEGYDKAIELTHSSHSGVMLETIKSATIKNCDDLLNILDGGSEDNV